MKLVDLDDSDTNLRHMQPDTTDETDTKDLLIVLLAILKATICAGQDVSEVLIQVSVHDVSATSFKRFISKCSYRSRYKTTCNISVIASSSYSARTCLVCH